MFYFCLAVFLVVGWLCPWWALAVAALILGLAFPTASGRGVALAAAVAWAALAYIKDGMSQGIISRRMSGLFSLPAAPLIFLLMAVLGAITALLFYKAGSAIRDYR
jgi:hypothetical protein